MAGISQAGLSRRAVLTGLGAAAAASALPAWAGSPKWAPLGGLAAQKNIRFGMALNVHRLEDTPRYADLAARECSIVTPENAMKWEALHPARDKYVFDQADLLVNFAEKHKIAVHGHTFVWHRALPPWVTREATTPQTAKKVLEEHIATVMGHYKGRVSQWDVINEAIQPKDGLKDNWRNSIWYQQLGPEYFDIAFGAAHDADPKAVLAYNDYGLEYENRSDKAKRARLLALLRELKKRGVPIGALGLQSHLRAGTHEKFGEDLPDFLHEVRDMGIQCWITELDVDDSRLALESEKTHDSIVADIYREYLELVLGTGCVNTVVTWGVWDQVRAIGAEAGVASISTSRRPLLFDSNGEPKPDAFAVAECFRDAPKFRS